MAASLPAGGVAAGLVPAGGGGGGAGFVPAGGRGGGGGFAGLGAGGRRGRVGGLAGLGSGGGLLSEGGGTERKRQSHDEQLLHGVPPDWGQQRTPTCRLAQFMRAVGAAASYDGAAMNPLQID